MIPNPCHHAHQPVVTYVSSSIRNIRRPSDALLLWTERVVGNFLSGAFALSGVATEHSTTVTVIAHRKLQQVLGNKAAVVNGTRATMKFVLKGIQCRNYQRSKS